MPFAGLPGLALFKETSDIVVFCTDVDCYAPAQEALSDDAVWRLSRSSGRRVACAASQLDVRIGWSGPARLAWLKAAAARFRCRPGRVHIVAAARVKLVVSGCLPMLHFSWDFAFLLWVLECVTCLCPLIILVLRIGFLCGSQQVLCWFLNGRTSFNENVVRESVIMLFLFVVS